MSKKFKLYTDGGARGNPGPAGTGFVVLEVTSGAEIILEKRGNYLGTATNNQAEYQALLEGLTWMTENNLLGQLDVYMDSLLIVNQINGKFKVKNAGLKPLYTEALALLKNFSSYAVRYVPREQNSEADALVNLTLDSRASAEE